MVQFGGLWAGADLHWGCGIGEPSFAGGRGQRRRQHL